MDAQLKLLNAAGGVAAYFRRDAAFGKPFPVSDVWRAAGLSEREHVLPDAEMAQLRHFVALRDSATASALSAPIHA